MADSNDYDGYYNNKEESYRVFFWNELIPPLVVYALTFVLGLTGNCLMIVTTFRYRRMHSVTNVFLCSLASSDLLLIIICIPVKVSVWFMLNWFVYSWSININYSISIHLFIVNLKGSCICLLTDAMNPLVVLFSLNIIECNGMRILMLAVPN